MKYQNFVLFIKKRLLIIFFFISTTITAQPLNSWLEFDGVNDYVDLGTSSILKPTNALTLELWAFNSDWENASKSIIICNTEQGGYNFKIYRGNISVIVRINGEYRYASYSLSNLSNNWHHFAATCDGQYVKLYVDGQLVDTEDAGAVYSIEYDSNNSTILGAEVNGKSSATGDYFEGAIDEVRIWNVVRTQSEIENNMYFHLVGNESGLVGYWKLDETSGNTATDETTNNNDGTLLNINESAWTEHFTQIAIPKQICDRSSLKWGDYNNDDYIDFIATGLDGYNEPITLLYSNNGNGSFSKQSTSIYDVRDGNAEWGDYNNDGYLDLIVTGVEYYSSRLARVYKNKKDGSFKESVSLTGHGIEEGSAIWGDYNNDGLLDFLIYGDRGGDYWPIKLFKNMGKDKFELQTHDLSFPEIEYGSATWCDYNNDGYLDLLFTGDGESNASLIYKNNGDETFTKTISLKMLYNSSIEWGDINSDGYTDLIIAGIDYNNKEKAILYKNNNGSSFTQIAEFTGIYDASIDFGDYDNDGDLDLVLSGTDKNNDSFSAIYKNNGDETFTQQSSINILSTNRGVLSWADIDNDGDLDLLQNGSVYGGYSTSFYLFENKSLISNSPPSSPTNLSSSVNGDEVTFSWDAPPDDKTPSSGLKYKISIGSSSGSANLLSSMSNTSNGFNRNLTTGEIITTNSVTIKDLPENSNIYWSVQAIDAGMKGSEFASEQSSSVLPVELTYFNADVEESDVVLNWETATEVNNYGFEVEKAETSIEDILKEKVFETIGFIEGHGNSNSAKQYQFVDHIDLSTLLNLGHIFEYRLKQIDTNGTYEYFDKTVLIDFSKITGIKEDSLPTKFELSQNYPNPFNPTTTINYSIPAVKTHTGVSVQLTIFDMLGRQATVLVNKTQSPGRYSVEFDADQLASGIYIYQLKTSSGFIDSKKLSLMK